VADPELSLADLSPDIVCAGSLSAALDEAPKVAGSSLRTGPSSRPIDANVISGTRWGVVTVAKLEHQFHLGIVENVDVQMHMAGGWTQDLSEIAAAIHAVVGNADQLVSERIQDFPFLELKPFALSWERGTLVEDHWLQLLEQEAPFLEERALAEPEKNQIFRWDDLAALIRAAAERPELRSLMPFTSLTRLGVRSPSDDPDLVIFPVWQARDMHSKCRSAEPSLKAPLPRCSTHWSPTSASSMTGTCEELTSERACSSR
jgi:hypothetical protein